MPKALVSTPSTEKGGIKRKGGKIINTSEDTFPLMFLDDKIIKTMVRIQNKTVASSNWAKV